MADEHGPTVVIRSSGAVARIGDEGVLRVAPGSSPQATLTLSGIVADVEIVGGVLPPGVTHELAVRVAALLSDQDDVPLLELETTGGEGGPE